MLRIFKTLHTVTIQIIMAQIEDTIFTEQIQELHLKKIKQF